MYLGYIELPNTGGSVNSCRFRSTFKFTVHYHPIGQYIDLRLWTVDLDNMGTTSTTMGGRWNSR